MSETRPLLLSSFDSGGGAARAALRLHQAFLGRGIPSTMVVEVGTTGAAGVVAPSGSWSRGVGRARPVLDRSPLLLYPNREGTIFSPAWLPGGGAHALHTVDHNILNLHWVNAGFLSVEAVGTAVQPLVWTLHDMWPLTGGCHHSDGCEAFKAACGACPQLGSRSSLDLSRLVLRRKQRTWDPHRMTIVAPSKWLADLAAESSIFRSSRIEVIPNPVDTERYRPVDRSLARKVLGLPPETTLIGFGAANASDPRKGGGLLRDALKYISTRASKPTAQVVIFGGGNGDDGDWSLPTHRLGRLHDDVSMALAYSAMDFLVQPSLAEVQSLVVAEAMACGIPSVAFATSGMGDLITSGSNGILATPFEVTSLAESILQLLSDRALREGLGQAARRHAVAEFSPPRVASRYVGLFAELL